MDFLAGIPKIPPSIISRVMAELGFPVVSFEDLGITENDAIELFIYPAMQIYFAYNPKQYKTNHVISGSVEIPFPTEDTFGVLQARVAVEGGGKTLLEGTVKYNPFRAHRYRSVEGANRFNLYDNPYYTRDVYLSERMARMSYMSLSKAGNMEIDRDNRLLRGYSTIGGELVVTWALCSSDWKDVRFEHEPDVVNLSKAHALRYFGMLNSQMDPNAGVQMNGEVFISRADALEEAVLEKWHNRTKIVVMR
jgi:hypothetical protein